MAVRGSGLQTILRSFDKSNKGLFTPVSIGSEDEITGVVYVVFFKGSLVLCSPGGCCAWSSPDMFRWQPNLLIWAAAQLSDSEGVSHDGILSIG